MARMRSGGHNRHAKCHEQADGTPIVPHFTTLLDVPSFPEQRLLGKSSHNQKVGATTGAILYFLR